MSAHCFCCKGRGYVEYALGGERVCEECDGVGRIEQAPFVNTFMDSGIAWSVMIEDDGSWMPVGQMLPDLEQIKKNLEVERLQYPWRRFEIAKCAWTKTIFREII